MEALPPEIHFKHFALELEELLAARKQGKEAEAKELIDLANLSFILWAMIQEGRA